MAGIYIHIPFCKKACSYCDFHFSTQLDTKTKMLQSIVKEIAIRKNFLQNQEIDSIYFGGGTPSILEKEELKMILDSIHFSFKVNPSAEITLEINPDDVTDTHTINNWQAIGFNRLSVGVQSFHDEHLKWMNRAHNADQSSKVLGLINGSEIKNFSLDLIYGLPNLSREQWLSNLNDAINSGASHISAYCLTIEEGTALFHLKKKGQNVEGTDEEVEWQVNIMVETLATAGFERYEISNFALPGRRSVHNSSYWKGAWYLGVGPSAHSFNGSSREWNISNNQEYIRSIERGNPTIERESIDETTAYNERIMTGLRTLEGVSLEDLKKEFLVDIKRDFSEELDDILEEEEAIIENEYLKLTHQGKFFADGIASSFFLEKE